VLERKLAHNELGTDPANSLSHRSREDTVIQLRAESEWQWLAAEKEIQQSRMKSQTRELNGSPSQG
jgi:hypothetical protein